MSAQVAHPAKPRILFVDDEKRVLNSMRAMFRRDYELFLTTRGDEALKIIAENPIDVLVADQRMPLMTGVEVLTAAKKCSPGTVRILLTGYSDLSAIEGAMNEGEVFRFLNKPCAANELRGTILEAAQIARDTADQVRRDGASEADVGETDMAALSSLASSPLVAVTHKPSLPEKALRRRLDTAANRRPAKTHDPASPKTNGNADSKSLTNGAAAPAPRKPSRPVTRDSMAKALKNPPKPSAEPDSGDTEDTVENPVIQPGLAPMEIVMAGDTITVVDPTEEEDAAPASPPNATLRNGAAPAVDRAIHTDTGTNTQAAPPVQSSSRIQCVGRGKYNISVIVFSPDDHFARAIGRALDGTFYTFHATNAVRLIEAIGKIAPAVLITDVTTDPGVIRNLSGMLKEKLPALVTMVAGKHRDAEVMIGLINHGQVFRFIDKPLSSAGCHKHVRDALKRHIVLRRNPELAKRYSVRSGGKLAGAVSERITRGLQRVKRLWGQKD